MDKEWIINTAIDKEWIINTAIDKEWISAAPVQIAICKCNLCETSISFSFPCAPDRIFLLYLPRLPCHLHLVVIEQQQQSGLYKLKNYEYSSFCFDIRFTIYSWAIFKNSV